MTSILKTRLIYILKKILPHKGILFVMWMYRFVFTIIYSGDSVTCPCCKKSFSKFVGSKQKSGTCPNCLSLSRHRFRQLFFESIMNRFDANASVLHFAPEPSSISFIDKLKTKKYVKADINSPIADEVIDITQITYPENFFDVVISSHVLEHIDDDIKALEEIYRVLKPNGIFINQVPLSNVYDTFEDLKIISKRDREKYYGHLDHRRLYGFDFKFRMKSVGFHVETINSDVKLDKDEKVKYGIDDNEIIFIGYK